MKKLITILGAATLALLTTSCMEENITLSINKDGSGTITETRYFGDHFLAEMARAEAKGKDPLNELMEQLKPRLTAMATTMGEGVSLTETKPLKENGKVGMVSVYEFKDINKLKYNPAQSLGNGPAIAPKAPLDIRYEDGVLTINNKHEKPVKDKQDANEKINEQDLKVIKEMMTDLRISLTLEFPGGIAETNAKHLDGNQFTMMDVNLGELAKQEDKLIEFIAAKPASMATAMAMLKDMEGAKIQDAEKITVKLN
jgi:hypothetical protein